MTAAISTRPAADLVVTGGSVIDGSGGPGLPLDVVVREGRVLDLVPHATTYDRAGTAVVDATGLVVAPGFIDLHSHADFSLPVEVSAESALAQGVTTLVAGNCGFSPFPYRGGPVLQRATSTFGPHLTWAWHDAASYADLLREAQPGVNIALQVGHAALRLAALGSGDRRPPTQAEQQTMEKMLDEAADQGVSGFSTGLIYAPGSFAEPAEVEGLARRAARHGLLYSTHLRNESGDLVAAVEEALTTARRASVRLEISHLKAMGPANHGRVDDAMVLIEQARNEGVDVACDVYPYTASSTMLSSRLPDWAMDGGPSRLLERLGDPDTRARVRVDLAARFGTDVDPAGVVLVEGEENTAGASLVDLGERWGVDPAEAALRALERAGGLVVIVNHAMAEADVESVLRYAHTSVASDGLFMTVAGNGRPHPRSFGTFARVLGRYVRDRGVLTLPEAIRKMTSLPASRLGVTDRGVLKPGAVADVVVFDPARVSDLATYVEPRQLALGVEHVLLSGRRAVRDGEVAAERNGAVLTG